MNNYEKEVMQSLLDDEEDVIAELRKQYQRALDDIGEKIRILQSDDLTESKIYQIEYQKALKGQIEGILTKMTGDNYSTISQYLNGCYTNGFIGTMFDMHGQGVPLLLPIDQNALIKAVLTDSKISSGLYDALGVDAKRLKKTIASEITRGLAAGQQYSDIARSINSIAGTGFSNAKRIVRTEGHRIQQAATYDAQQASKAKGADVFKQWDATLDGLTRENHRLLDGQLQEVDDPFEIGGKKAMYPGDFGDPAEDCNCRCVSLTRPRWALDDDELQTLKDRAALFGLDMKQQGGNSKAFGHAKGKQFEEFKNKYQNATKILENTEKSGIIKEGVKVVKPSAPKSKIQGTDITIDIEKTVAAAKNGTRHSGVYNDAVAKTESRLKKSIASHDKEVEIHKDKIAHPEKYVPDWDSKTPQEKEWIIKKWEKDAKRNAEQAAIEREVYKERFGVIDE